MNTLEHLVLLYQLENSIMHLNIPTMVVLFMVVIVEVEEELGMDLQMFQEC